MAIPTTILSSLSSCDMYHLDPTAEATAADLYRLSRQPDSIFDALNQGNISTTSAIFAPRDANGAWILACLMLCAVTVAVLYPLGAKQLQTIIQTPRRQTSLEQIQANSPKYFSAILLGGYGLIVLCLLGVTFALVYHVFTSINTNFFFIQKIL